eukprot:5580936-Prymnesium_polylepis.1
MERVQRADVVADPWRGGRQRDRDREQIEPPEHLAEAGCREVALAQDAAKCGRHVTRMGLWRDWDAMLWGSDRMGGRTHGCSIVDSPWCQSRFRCQIQSSTRTRRRGSGSAP